jgi:hypothetical protein
MTMTLSDPRLIVVLKTKAKQRINPRSFGATGSLEKALMGPTEASAGISDQRMTTNIDLLQVKELCIVK